MKVLLYGTSPLVGSGYASAIRYVSQGLQARGHEAAVFAWNSHAGQRINWNGVQIYPRANALNGFDGLGPFSRHFGADVILALCDPWVMSPEQWRCDHSLPVVFWYPCQSNPASGHLVQTVKTGDGAWCYSQWGNKVMREAGVATEYVPLGIDPEVFRPLDRAECREWFGRMLGLDLGDRTLVGMVAANASTVPISRKAFDQNLIAFKIYRELYDPDAVMYLHAWAGPHQGGFDLRPLVDHLGLLDCVHFADPAWYIMGLPDDWLARMYNALDVACQATSAEGFGLPVVEAQACGTPVVTTDFSSMPELTVNGLRADVAARLWAPPPMDGWVAVPDAESIANAICALLEVTPAQRQAGVDFARSLAWDRIIDKSVVPLLSSVCQPHEASI